MENIVFAANVVLPLLIMMAAGYLVRQLKLLSGPDAATFNNLAFMVFLPILLFNSIRSSNLTSLANPSLFIFVIVGTLASFGIAALVVPHIESDNPTRGVMIQGMARTNYSLFGIPLIMLLMPGADTGTASVLVAVVIPIYNVVSVTILTYYGCKNANLKSVATSILKNPLIWGSLAGIVFLIFNLKLPTPLDSACVSLGAVATPLSLFLLGATFEFGKLQHVLKQTIITVSTRLVIIPGIVLILAVLMGFRGVDLACIMIVFATPTAVSSYTMAAKMGGNAPLASAIVLFSSIFSIFSLFFIILILRTLQLL